MLLPVFFFEGKQVAQFTVFHDYAVVDHVSDASLFEAFDDLQNVLVIMTLSLR